ncbi:DUF1838 domain-containing protein [Synechocystis salina LEGE 00031]|uniref:DUF1838 domain-containing protein n=1 Tax=Synechocystis salina LEGE 00031 TaxID=1828736 RepID=A0ABR9VT60_9SYNC|nr:DUF1838 domain-containing protein [Synechocystis salina LEGE 00041]MBE9254536.1 DUF1838 domain-containing protein [Synechocystis salina LEGE 00031]
MVFNLPKFSAALLSPLSLVLLLVGMGENKVEALELREPAGQLQALRKIFCSTEDGQPITYWWEGKTYSRIPGEPDRLLFLVEGMNIRQCGPLADGNDDEDFRMVSREILLYKDPVTGEVLRQWENPWTGKTVEVFHVANDPVNFSYRLKDNDGSPIARDITVRGNQWWINVTVPLFYPNPLGGEFQRYVGGTYHATEMFNFFGSVDELSNPRQTSAPASIGWARLSNWLPWMEMGNRVGLLYFHTAGRKLASFDDLSVVMKTEIANNFPEYVKPPSLSDQRPNETSWSSFRQLLESGGNQ